MFAGSIEVAIAFGVGRKEERDEAAGTTLVFWKRARESGGTPRRGRAAGGLDWRALDAEPDGSAQCGLVQRCNSVLCSVLCSEQEQEWEGLRGACGACVGCALNAAAPACRGLSIEPVRVGATGARRPNRKLAH